MAYALLYAGLHRRDGKRLILHNQTGSTTVHLQKIEDGRLRTPIFYPQCLNSQAVNFR